MTPVDSFLWHDYETFGAQPMLDRPAQFAAQRTDSNLNPTGDPLTLYCSPADDVLPHPAACLITGITPQEARKKGVCETEFAAAIHHEMMKAGTCSAGYNSIRFDDVVTRSLFYRNLRDPYEREYRNGNSRWDLIDLARMCYALRPDGINWPMVPVTQMGGAAGDVPSERPSFRLEDLCAANAIPHEGAHDALADVRATIDLARLIKNAQPRLFDWALTLRKADAVWPLLDPADPKAVLHTSSRIPATRGCTSMVLPLAVSSTNAKAVVVFDLMADPEPLINESAETIADLVFTPTADLPPGLARLPLKLIRTNSIPMVAPAATLKDVDLNRIGLDPDRCRTHEQSLLARLDQVRPKVMEVFSQPFTSDTKDPDLMLYSGKFFSAGDRHLMNKILQLAGNELSGHLWSFQDDRLPLMLFRYRARNYPETLTTQEQAVWTQDRHRRLIATADDRQLSYQGFLEVLEQHRQAHPDDARAIRILDSLESWAMEIGLPELAESDISQD
jgi:exodeoxyribonuclease-1